MPYGITVTCHPAEVTLPPLPPAEARTGFSDPGGMQGWVDLGGGYIPNLPNTVTYLSNNQAVS